LKMSSQKVCGFVLRRLSGISTSSLSDAARNLQPEWPAVQTLGAGINPLHKVDMGTHLMGFAFTVKCAENNYGGLVHALQHITKDSVDPQNLVICVDTCGSPKAVAGSLLSTEFHRLGINGLVVDGNIRDVAGVRRVGDGATSFPVYSRGVNPTAGTGDQPGQIQVPITMGDEKITINNGDVILGDDDGIVVVNLVQRTECLREYEQISLLSSLLDEAKRIENRDDAILEQISKGKALLDCL